MIVPEIYCDGMLRYICISEADLSNLTVEVVDISWCVKGLVTNYGEGGGGLQNGRGGGHMQSYPYKKGGPKKFKPCRRGGGAQNVSG